MAERYTSETYQNKFRLVILGSLLIVSIIINFLTLAAWRSEAKDTGELRVLLQAIKETCYGR